jgi:uncharacterized repeat protein (TIGR03809 family)
MPDHQPPASLQSAAQKWRILADRRRTHFVDLFKSGRWKHYYTEQRFLQVLRETVAQSERWAMIAPPQDKVPVGDGAAFGEYTAPAVDEAAAPDEEGAPAVLQRSAA